MKTQILFKVLLLITLLTSAAGCGGQPVTPAVQNLTPSSLPAEKTPVPMQTVPTPTAIPSNPSLQDIMKDASGISDNQLPPQVMDTHPASGEEARLDAAIETGFDQAMDPRATESAWQMKAPDGSLVSGKFSWPSDERLRFTPDRALLPATSYTVTISEKATSMSAVALRQIFTWRVNTLTPLGISQVFPADGSTEVDVSSRITLMFNRPVVALGIQEEQKNLPQPAEFSPAISGTGTWLNTSVYVFQPKAVLRSGTTYSVRVAAGLKDSGGDPATALVNPFEWKFTTRAGQLWQIEVDGQVFDPFTQASGYNLALVPKMTLRFLQPMQPTSTNAAVSLSDDFGKLIPLRFQWSGDNRSVLAAPLIVLPMGGHYTLKVNATAQTQDGGQLGRALLWNLNTIPVPNVIGSDPADGSTGSGSSQLALQFASPMDPKTIAARVIFKPALTNKENFFYNTEDNIAYFYGLQPSTAYEVQVIPGMLDRYGNALNTGRIFRFTTAALAPWAGLNLPYNPFYLTSGSQDFYYYYTNVSRIDFKIYRVSPKDFILDTGGGKGFDPNVYKPVQSDLVSSFQVTADAALNKNVIQSHALQDKDGKPLGPGFYLLFIDSPQVSHGGSAAFLDYRFLSVSVSHLTFKNSDGDALVWATDPASGKPISGVALKIYNSDFKMLAEGKTDPTGVLHVDLPLPTTPDQGSPSRFVVSEDAKTFAFASSNWDSGVYTENFGISQSYYNPQTLAYVYTDRPLYRTGQPVYFKGILRKDNDLAYTLPGQKEVEVMIQSYDQVVYRQTLALSDYGAFSGEFMLDAEAALGSYNLEVRFTDEASKAAAALGGVSFTVAEYRKPEFQVNVGASPANLLAGQTITASVLATYYSGGGVKGAEAAWTLRSDPFFFQPPPELSSFSFYDDNRDSGLEGYRQNADRPRIVAEGKAFTGPDGKLILSLPASVQSAAGSQRLTLEVTVTDFAGNAVSAQAAVTAHRSAVYVGIRPTQYVGKTGEEQTFEVAAVDWDGKPVAKQGLDVAISERQWYNVQELDGQGVLRWISSVKDIPVARSSGLVSDEQGRAVMKFTPTKGGVYRALVTAYDRSGNLSRSAAYQWTAGPEYIPWRQSNDRTFQLVVDQDSYKPGDTAGILIASPFQGSVYALVTVERGRVRHQEVLQLSGNSTLYRLPVTVDMAPVVYISVVVVKGVDASNPRPSYKVGMARVNVSTEQQALKVEVSSDPRDAAPGETVKFNVKTSAADGKGVPAEVSLGLSDLATLSLMPPNSGAILNYFYGERLLSVRTSITITASMDDYNAQLAEGLATGQGAGGGGAKGEGAPGVPAVRQNFPDTAYWKADLRTGADGQAQVSVTLPDNLTTWRMDARGVTLDTRAGQTTLDLVSTRPLLVRPQTPRFFVGGDQAVLGAAVHNNTGQDLSIDVSLDAKGVQLRDAPVQTVTLKSGEQALVTWKVSVPEDSTRVDLVFSAKGGSFSDASRPTLGTLDNQGIPVYRYEVPETVATSGELDSAGVRLEAIRLPAQMKISQAGLTVKIEPSLAAGMTDGLAYLEHYPYECTEQTVSRFLPNVATVRALQSAGMNDPALVENLKQQVSAGLQRLYVRQNPDGGWGWWNGTSDSLTSAYVVLGLVEAKAAGFGVDKNVLDNGLNYLNLQVSSFIPETGLNKAGLDAGRNRQTFLVYVLTRAEKTPVSAAVALYDKREWLSLYSRALLAEVLFTVNAGDPRAATLRSDLVNAAVISATGTHWEEQSPDTWNWNTDTRSTAIILGVLTRIDPKNPLAANAVRWLMSNRSDGRWHSTQETAWSLMALTDWMVRSGELKADYAYAVQLNGKQIGAGKAYKENLRTPVTLQVAVQDLLQGEANRLVFARDGEAGVLYYTSHLTIALPVPEVKAIDQGIFISRRYYALNDLKNPITQAAPGQILQVQLTLVAAHDLRYVLVDDPLPGGLEALDTSLKSSPTNQAPFDYNWERAGSEGWGWWYFSHAEMRDEKVVLSTSYLPAGTYTYTYQVRATTTGTFQVIPPSAQEFYFPEVNGRGDGSVFVVK